MNESLEAIEPERKHRFRFLALVKIAVAIFIFTYLFSQTSPLELLSLINRIDLANVCICIAVLFWLNLSIAIRWRFILRHFGKELQIASLWRFTMIGAFFNQFLPTGMGGDLFRIGYVRKSGVPLITAVTSVVVDRIIGFLSLFILVGIGAPYLFTITHRGAVTTTLLFLLSLLATAIFLFIRFDLLYRALSNLPYIKKSDSSQGFFAHFIKSIDQCAEDTRSLLRKWPDGFIVIFLSFANQTMLGLVVFLLARGLGGHLELIDAVVVFPFVLLLSMIPISLAGWGLRETAMVVVFGLRGMPKEIALGVSVLFGICLILSALPGAFLWLVAHYDGSKRLDD